MGYQFKTQPWEHQKNAIRKAWGRRAFAYFMEMGSGKTKVAIDESCALYESLNVEAVVIMAPKGVYKNWIREEGEIETHMPDHIRKAAVIATWEPGGGNSENIRQLQKALSKGAGLRVFIINTESVQTAGKARAYLEKFLRTHRCYWAVDESTFIKNADASRTKYIVSCGPLAAFRRILTGSPNPRSPMDFYSQFEFLQPGLLGFTSFFSFRARYAHTKKVDFRPKEIRDSGKKGRDTTVIVGYRNLDELQAKIAEHSFRVTKAECMDLPPKVFVPRDVDLTPEQIRIYDGIKKEALAMLSAESFVSTPSVITQLLRLQQVICGHVVDDDGTVHDIPTNRVEALMETVQETDGKVIIWSRFRRDIEAIAQALSKEYGPESVAQFHGGNVKTRQAEADSFIRDPERRFMISNAQSGGRGNTWIVADTVIYFSNDFDLENRIQSEDRAHRGGQTKSVTYVDLIARGTVDERIVKALRTKMDIASAVTGDDLQEWLI